MSVSKPANNSARLPGLDLLRCLAASLVFLQHSLSSCHYDDAIDVAGFRIGRIGTAIFFLLGGFLCAKSSRRPTEWLRDRLKALLPAYWIIVAIGFGIAAVVRSKEFDLWQVICQFAGIGYFTHGDRLINVATWFITPLLIFYGIATLLRTLKSNRANFVTVLVFSTLAVLNPGGYETALCHGATFFVAFALNSGGAVSRSQTLLTTLLFSIMCFVQPEFRYASIATALLLPSLQIQRPSRLAAAFTTVAYEWFLVHGIVITGVSRMFANPVPMILVSIPVSLIGAWLLKTGTARCLAMLSKILRKEPGAIEQDTRQRTTHSTTNHSRGSSHRSAIIPAPHGSKKTKDRTLTRG